MEKAKKLWKRFMALADEQAKLDSIPAIGKGKERNAYLVNVFTNDGIRRARALQLLQDLEKILENEGVTLQEFARLA